MIMEDFSKQKRETRRYPSRLSRGIVKRYNLLTGGYVFVQDNKDRNKFHMPGGLTSTESKINDLAKEKGWQRPKRQYINRMDLE